MTEYELVVDAKSGDRQAFQTLMNIARPRLERTVRYYVKNDFDMKDVIQDAMVKAFVSIETVKEEKYFFTWLTKIAMHCALDFLQKQKRIIPVEEVIPACQARKIDEMDRSLIVSEAISALPLKQRQVITLKYLKDLKLREISKMVNRPLGSVKTDLHKGLKQLRKELCDPSNSKLMIEETLHMMKDDLKQRALSIVEIPSHLQLEVEDYQNTEAFFSWADSCKDDGILITLDQAGNLKSLTYDIDEAYLDEAPLSAAEKQTLAEQFICDHYPNALATFTLIETKEMKHWMRFEYGQMMLDLPLPQSGCYIDVSHSGVIVQFRYYGEKKRPNQPKTLRSKDELFEKMREMNEFELTIAKLYKGIYENGNDELRLVYRVENSFCVFEADAEKRDPVHEDDDVEVRYEAVLPASIKGNSETATIEDLIGITDIMVKLREKDMGNEIGVVWCDAKFEEQKYDKSLNSFFQKQTEETVKARIDKESGCLKGFWWFKERKGELQLSRKQCYEKALEFLRNMYPTLAKYAEVKTDERCEDDEPNEHEAFQFRVHNGVGVLFESGYLMVSVNRTTGFIDMYSSLDIELHELAAVPSQPNLSKVEAAERFFAALDFKLEWEINYEGEDEEYHLVYKPVHEGKDGCARYIDALTGEFIFGKH